MKRYPILLSLILLPLSACAQSPKPVPSVMMVANLEDLRPQRLEIVEVPVPLALPEQLKLFPDKTDTAKPGMSKTTVEEILATAKRQPDDARHINAITVYPYSEGALYQLQAAVDQVTDIALEAGEQLLAVSAGDTVRWIVGDAASGEGAAKRTHILVKPTAPDLVTNLVILTSRRSYHLELRSTPKTGMVALSWDYPRDRLLALRREKAAVESAVETVAAAGLRLSSLRFGYEISGDRPAWRPLRAFDDGRQVYIQFPEALSVSEAPPLFVLTEKGEAALVNYRVQGRFYVVDRLFDAAELRLGGKRQTVVRIRRTEARP